MRWKRWALVLTVGAIVCGIWWGRTRPYTPTTPPEIGIWYWHSPFQIPKQDAESLKAMNIRDVYVRAGTFTYRNTKASLIIPQVWKSGAEGFRVHLVFNFDYTIAPRFGMVPNDVLASAVIEGVRAERKKAEGVGVKVAGIQFDLDCPTKRLPKYAELLKILRAALRDTKTEFSITALPTWFTSRELALVTAQTDFYIPQYYEAQFSDRIEKDLPISHLPQVMQGLKSGGRGDAPFFVGIPAYGHARLYDDKGALRGLFRQMPAAEMLRHPAFELEQSYGSDAQGKPATAKTFIGEELYRFRATQPAESGEGKGYYIIYDLPTAPLVAAHIELLRKYRPANCRGGILFRYPQPGETMTIPWKSLKAALANQPTQPDLQVKVKSESLPWDMIETGKTVKSPPKEIAVTVTNSGTANAFLGDNAMTLMLYFDRSGIEEIDKGEFDTIEAHALPTPNAPPTNATRSSLRFANAVHLTRKSLGVGETVSLGSIRLPANSATAVSGSWTMRGIGDFETLRGTVPTQKISP